MKYKILVMAIAMTFAAVAQAAPQEKTASLRAVGFVPLAELSKNSRIRVISAVDPNAVYSNITNFGAQAVQQGPSSGGITRMIMDDLTFTTAPSVGMVTTIVFAVANQNATAQSVRARIRFWNADGASLGSGLPNGPGTYYAPGGTAVGFSFNPFTFAPGVTTLTGTLGAGFPVPAGVTTTLWAGITYDNVGTTTAATDTELSLFGQGLFNPVDLGSSTNTLFETTAAEASSLSPTRPARR